MMPLSLIVTFDALPSTAFITPPDVMLAAAGWTMEVALSGSLQRSLFIIMIVVK